MKFPKILFAIAILLFTIGIFISTYSISTNSAASPKQTVPLFALQASETEISKVSFANSLAVSLSKSDKDLYTIRQNIQNIGIIDETRKIEKNIPAFPLAAALSVNSRGRIFVAGDSKLNIIETKGGRKQFIIPATTTSIAALDDNKVVIAAPDFDRLLTVFDDTGNVVSKIGNLKQLERSDPKENLFLNSGKVVATQSGEIFYVSMFSPTPIIQKFSKQGQLLKEFAIEGAGLELQSKRAKDFLSRRRFSCVGGYYVVRSLSVDPVTNHVWIGINGLTEKGTVRAESGVLYEYTPDGEKLAEYALAVTSANGEINAITDIKDIAIKTPYVNILTSAGQIYQFNLEQRMTIMPKVQEVKRHSLLNSFIPASWTPSLFKKKSFEQCEREMTPAYNCEDDCPSGSFPQKQDCDAELSSKLDPGEIIITGTCSRGTQVSQNGGCSGSITGCEDNGTTVTRVTYSVTMVCNAAPTPTPTPPPGGGPQAFCTAGYHWDDSQQCCADLSGQCQLYSPIVIDIEGNGFNLTNRTNGVDFDLNSDNRRERLSWTTAGSDDAWLALDRNGNGLIDNGKELFGNFTLQPPPPAGVEKNGFLALTVYDKQVNGGNNDGVIDAGDSIFTGLRLWQDTNHNGASEANELHNLPEVGIAKLELKYHESKRTDEFGNQFRYRAKVWDVHGAQTGRWAWDVFLLTK